MNSIIVLVLLQKNNVNVQQVSILVLILEATRNIYAGLLQHRKVVIRKVKECDSPKKLSLELK